jgi:predicted TIM-barrel fold metal-dependent hydrolase
MGRLVLALAAITMPIATSQTLTFEEYRPVSSLVVPENPTPRARFPVIDIHSHHRDEGGGHLDRVVREMDEQNLRMLVNLSGGSGERLKKFVANYTERYPGRFAIFANLDFDGIDSGAWGTKAAMILERDVENGAQGLKIFKNLGLTVFYKDGHRVPVDDPVLGPVWRMCAKLKIPVLIHVAEPAPFFEPFDNRNERWLELKMFPQRRRPPDKFPRFEALTAERDRLVAKHPDVNFIIAHLGWHGNDLARLGRLMDRYPNFYTEVAAVLAELGRQPFTARKFLIRYKERVLFGKDIYRASEFPYYWRVLETQDEYFDYYRRRHANWKLYGLNLPDRVLKHIYYKNALRLVPGIDSGDFPE